MSEANKVLVRRMLEEAIPVGDVATLGELLAPDFLDHDPLPGQPPGAASGEYVIRTMHAAYSDLRFTIEDLIAEGDRVVVRWTLRATNTGPLFGRPATGGAVKFAAIIVYRVAEGRLAERWAAWKPGFAPV